MAILVTGGAGYIGSHTAARLIEAGEQVIVLDNLAKGHRSAVWPGCQFIEMDLHDQTALQEVFKKNDIESVIHFAAYSLVGESVTNPLKYFDNNIGCTKNLLACMVEAGVRDIVFSSTAAVYGEPERVPIQEDNATRPTNPYGESKLTIEKMLKWCEGAYGIRYAALRYFNAAGARPDGLLGEDHTPETHLIPLILKVALGEGVLKIFGDDYDTPDGTCVRDYIHVLDLADAHIAALTHLRNGGESGAYNLGNGNGFSVQEVVQVARQVTGKPILAELAPRRAGDPAILVASSKKAREVLGWTPQHDKLEDMIETAWRFHKNYPNGFPA